MQLATALARVTLSNGQCSVNNQRLVNTLLNELMLLLVVRLARNTKPLAQ